MIVGPFLVSSKKTRFFLFRKWSSVDYVPRLIEQDGVITYDGALKMDLV